MDLQKTLLQTLRLFVDGFVRKICGFEMHQTTVNGKTDVAIAFIQGAASEEHLTYIRERLDKIIS